MTVAIEVTGKLERAAEVTNELIGVVEIKLMTEVNDAFIEITGVVIIELILMLMLEVLISADSKLDIVEVDTTRI